MADFEYAPNLFNFNDRGTYFEIVAKKEATRIPSTGEYYFDPFLSLWDKVDKEVESRLFEIEKDKPEPFDVYLQKEIPDFYYDLEQDPSTSFDGWIANAIQGGGYTDASGNVVPIRSASDVAKAVDYAWNNLGGQLGMTNENPFVYQNAAKSKYLSLTGAFGKYREKEQQYKDKKKSVYSDMGLPDKSLRYDPTTVPQYKQWEDEKVKDAVKTLGLKSSDSARINQIRMGIRKGAADRYAELGYSPWHDAVLLARASS